MTKRFSSLPTDGQLSWRIDELEQRVKMLEDFMTPLRELAASTRDLLDKIQEVLASHESTNKEHDQ